MRTKWTTRTTIAAFFFAAATFAIAFVLGFAITNTFGPGTSGFLSTIFTTILVVLSARITKLRWIFTFTVTLFTILAIPTNLFGPAGPHKVLIGFLVGFIYDIVWEWTGRRSWSLPVAAFIATASSLFLIYEMMLLWFQDHDSLANLSRIVLWASPIYGGLGVIGALIGNWLYRKQFKDLSYVKYIQGDAYENIESNTPPKS